MPLKGCFLLILMRRYFRIGFSFFIYSIIPISIWFVLSLVTGNREVANVFSITYSIQFIVAILTGLFASGANIRKEKTKDANAANSSMLWGIIFASIIFSLLLIFSDNYIAFFGLDVEFYRIFVRYSIILFFEQALISFMVERLYFEDKEKEANLILILFNAINFLILIPLVAITQNILISTIITLSTLFVFVIVLYVKNFQKFKINFKFYKNFRYDSANIISNLAMLIIYFFGFKIAFSAGPEYLLALNIVGLSTDAQWDSLEAIRTIAKVDISKDRFNYTKELKNSQLFTFVVILSTILMSFTLGLINSANLWLIAAYLAFQVFDMAITPFIKIISVKVQIDYSPVLNTALQLSLKVIRTLISIIIISPYCTDIGQVVSEAVLFIALIIIRFTKFKFKKGNLVLKNKKI